MVELLDCSPEPSSADRLATALTIEGVSNNGSIVDSSKLVLCEGTLVVVCAVVGNADGIGGEGCSAESVAAIC